MDRVGVGLKLLGPPEISRLGEPPTALPRRIAGLLAYLAIEGPTQRGHLAALLWPDASSATARNDLAQSLRRLHRLTDGAPVVAGRDRVQLASGVVADVRGLFAPPGSDGRPPDPSQLPGCLLGDEAFDDCEGFSDWLREARFRVDRVRAAGWRRLADERQRRGERRDAVFALERLLELEPYAEDGWRRLIQWLHEAGDRGGALAAYARCVQVLQREVGAEPADETRRLAERIRGETPRERRAAGRPVGPRSLPAAVLHPPRLVGRESAWAEMEAAWERGAGIFLSGPPGAGKTRLMREFLRSKGTPYLFEGRPDDVRVPYATHARTYRQMLEYFPALALPGWVESEIARLLPERGPEPAEAPVPLRFLQAQAEATRLAVEAGMVCVGVDDLQFVDSASLVAGHFVYSAYWGRVDGMRTVICLRDDELQDEARSMLDRALAAQSAVLISVGPLDEGEAMALVASLDVGLDARAPELARRSGGNPLFLLEMVRSLLARDGDAQSGALELPRRVRQLVAERLARMQPEARDLLRVAALAGERMGARLASRVLGVPLVRLSAPWAELEAAQILRGERFAHDLLREVATEEIPEVLRKELEERIDEAAAGLDARRPRAASRSRSA